MHSEKLRTHPLPRGGTDCDPLRLVLQEALQLVDDVGGSSFNKLNPSRVIDKLKHIGPSLSHFCEVEPN